MNSRLTNALVTSILIAILFPMIPTAVVGITWLATFGGFDFMVVARSIPMILLSGIMACTSIISGIANFDDKYGI
jgi:hypothetical protein